MSEARFEIHEDTAGEYRWRLRAANGEIVAAGESYRDAAGARRAIDDMLDTVLAAVQANLTGPWPARPIVVEVDP